MAKNRNPQAITPPKPTREQLKRSPEANATRSRAKGVPQPDPKAEADYESRQSGKSEKH